MQDSIAQQVKATVRQIDPQAEVILFGSRARGNA
jgi:predicted nucleotidyltransferase